MGGGGLSKIRACLYFGKCGNLRTVPYYSMKGCTFSRTKGNGYGDTGFTQEHSRQMRMRCEHIKRECKWSPSTVDFERRIASMPSTPAGQPFAAHWLLGCEQRSPPCQVGCMHLPNCHSRRNLLPRTGYSAVNNAVYHVMEAACIYLTVTRTIELCALTSPAILEPFLGGALFHG